MAKENPMSAREAILMAILAARGPERPRSRYAFPSPAETPRAHFEVKAKGSFSRVVPVAGREAVPEAASELLRSANAAQRLHVPEGSPLTMLPWQRTPYLALTAGAPTGEDVALAEAAFAIAETGTLVFASGRHPSSWHFLPGREIVLIEEARILPRMEDVLARIAAEGMPATLNLVTGPSRTGDIEQTIELGAHGPKALDIVLIGD